MANPLTPANVEKYILKTGRYERATPPTKTVVSFQTIDGRQLALTLMDVVPQVWLESGKWLTTDLEALFSKSKIVRYRPDESKHPNVERKAPRLARGNAVTRVVVPNLDLLVRLLTAYEQSRAPSSPAQSPNAANTTDPKEVNLVVMEGVLRETRYWARSRNKKLRDEKLSTSDGICECCRVNYSILFEGAGWRALQVHHRKQLASFDEPQFTTSADLAVVCGNCHLFIHANPKAALTVEELRRRWEQDGSRIATAVGKTPLRGDA